VLAAILNMDGAWIDIAKRKLAIPNSEIQKIFTDFPKAEEFAWVDPLKK
jgi:acyl-CoA thioester hydrolase